MARQVNIAEAKARLSELIDAALAGEDVAGRVAIASSFDDPLPELADYT